MNNYEKMLEHNKRYKAGEVSWFMQMHEDMDLTSEEWIAKRVEGLPYYDNTTVFTDTFDERVMKKLAEPREKLGDFSWIDSGMVSSVKNQAQCGSCAAFAAIGALESCSGISAGSLANDLSEQHILDCAYNHIFSDASGDWGAYGCDGAWPQAYYDWLIMNGEYNQEESAYPYTSGRTGDVGACSPSSNGYNTNFRLTGMQNQWYTKENDMEGLIAINPVVTAVQVTNNWGSYGGGILDDSACCEAAYDSSCVYNLNHAVLVVGYGSNYWLVKNSWGTSWGEHGFFKIKRGTGHCGIGSLHQTIPVC
eukprot:TRINITY_DN7376_c0_g1_i2.p1 TRINITY_DN7376_c0_g1~~TRINITY_DN7376_c0_g1_i2.p1  ORF type:complete len:307 (+),score=90.81 TRINITY_DN7376_c0_g1_i2:171-1091(+)